MSTLMRTNQTAFLTAMILVVIFMSLSLKTQAQEFRMGLSLSPNVGWMISTDYDHTPQGAKLHFGYNFIADVLFSDNYALGLGVHIFNTGGKVRYLVVDPVNDNYLMNVDRTYSLQYVELPLTFKMRTKEMGYSTIFGKFGLGLGMNIRAEADEARYRSFQEVASGVWTNFDPGGSPLSDRIEIENDVRLFRVAMIVGGGIERTLSGSTALTVGLNYNAAFSNIHKNINLVKVDNNQAPVVIDYLPSMGEMKGHDSFLELSLGILF